MRDEMWVGQIGVQLAAAELLREGWEVAVPLVDTGHDLVAYEGSDRHIRVQVKSSSGDTKQKVFRVQRQGKGGGKRLYEDDVVDAVAVCNLSIGEVSFVPMKSLNGKSSIAFSSPLLVGVKDLRSAMDGLD